MKAARFCSHARKGIGSIGDMFQIHWEGALFYVFPPFPPLIKVMEKARKERLNTTLVSPFWPCHFFPQPLWISPGDSISPCLLDLIIINQVLHHNLNGLGLMVWNLRHFGRRLMTYSCIHTNLILKSPICINGRRPLSGAVEGRFL